MEPERDPREVPAAAEQFEAPFEEGPRTIGLCAQREPDAEPVERARRPLLVAELVVDGQSLLEERLCLRVVAARPLHEREPVSASAMPFGSPSERDRSSAARQSSSAWS